MAARSVIAYGTTTGRGDREELIHPYTSGGTIILSTRPTSTVVSILSLLSMIMGEAVEEQFRAVGCRAAVPGHAPGKNAGGPRPTASSTASKPSPSVPPAGRRSRGGARPVFGFAGREC